MSVDDDNGRADSEAQLKSLLTEYGFDAAKNEEPEAAPDAQEEAEQSTQTEPPTKAAKPEPVNKGKEPPAQKSHDQNKKQRGPLVVLATNAFQEWLLALRGKSKRISRRGAYIIAAVVLSVFAFVVIKLSGHHQAPAHAQARIALHSDTPPITAKTATVSNAPAHHSLVANSSTSDAIATTNTMQTGAPAVGWSVTAAGDEARVTAMMHKGAEGTSAQVDDSDFTAPSAPIPVAIAPSAASSSADPAVAPSSSEANYLALKIEYSNAMDAVKGLGAKVDALQQQVNTLSRKVQVDPPVSADTLIRPPLTVQSIVLASGCADCSAVARVLYQGQSLTLRNDDAFLNFTVGIKGNTLVLRSPRHTYTYLASGVQP